MKNKTIRYVRLCYGILTGVAAVAAGICLIAACISIYRSGGQQIYTPDKVRLAFHEIAVPVYLALSLTVGGWILDIALPRPEAKRKPEKSLTASLERLMTKRNPENFPEAFQKAIAREQRSRKLHAGISVALLVVCSVVFLCYGANPTNFHQSEINDSMVSAMLVMLPCLAIPFGYGIFTAYYTRASLRRQISLVKQLPADQNPSEPQMQPAKLSAVQTVRCVVVCLALVMLVYGFVAGGTADVLTKAVNICTECVGLG